MKEFNIQVLALVLWLIGDVGLKLSLVLWLISRTYQGKKMSQPFQNVIRRCGLGRCDGKD